MKALLTNLVIMVVAWLIDQTKNEDITAAGDTVGRWLTDNAKAKIGDGWDKVEDKLQIKLAVFMGGFHAGLDYDDKGK